MQKLGNLWLTVGSQHKMMVEIEEELLIQECDHAVLFPKYKPTTAAELFTITGKFLNCSKNEVSAYQ